MNLPQPVEKMLLDLKVPQHMVDQINIELDKGESSLHDILHNMKDQLTSHGVNVDELMSKIPSAQDLKNMAGDVADKAKGAFEDMKGKMGL